MRWKPGSLTRTLANLARGAWTAGDSPPADAFSRSARRRRGSSAQPGASFRSRPRVSRKAAVSLRRSAVRAERRARVGVRVREAHVIERDPGQRGHGLTNGPRERVGHDAELGVQDGDLGVTVGKYKCGSDQVEVNARRPGVRLRAPVAM